MKGTVRLMENTIKVSKGYELFTSKYKQKNSFSESKRLFLKIEF